MKELRGVEEIASLTRQELSSFILSHQQSFDDDWACSCLVCSWVLNQTLRSYGIKSELCIGLYDGSDHAFVTVGDYVVDITATQFRRPEIVVERLNGSDYTIRHQGQAARLEMKEWPFDQQPRTYRKKLGKIIKRLNQQGAGDHVKSRIGASEEGK